MPLEGSELEHARSPDEGANGSAWISDEAGRSAHAQIRQEIELEEQLSRNSSVLRQGMTRLFGLAGGEDKIAELKRIGATANSQEMLAAVERSRRERLREQDVAEIGSAALKTATLFLRGRAAPWLTVGLFALDEIKPNTSGPESVIDGVLGAGKGLATRRFLEWSQGKGLNPAKAGVLLGGLNRLADGALSRRTYLDAEGAVSPNKALREIVTGTLNPAAVAMDAAIFTAAGKGTKLADSLSGGRIASSPFWRNVITGHTFGLSTGFSSEAMRQYQEGRLDLGRLAGVTLARGLIDAVAAMPGGYQAKRASRFNAAKHGDPIEAAREKLPALESTRLSPEALSRLRNGNFERRLSTRIRTAEATPELDLGKLTELYRELGTPFVRNETFVRPRAGEQHAAQEASEWARLNLEKAERSVRVYRADGIEIVVPEAYDTTLGQLRQWRLSSPGKEMPADHPLYEYRDRLLPEEILAAIRSTPQPDLITRVRLINETNPMDAFLQQRNPSHRSAADSTPEGEITLYKAKRSSLFEEDFLHEWSHIAKWKLPHLSYAFDLAAGLEADGHFANNYARRGGVDENFAVHTAEELANPSLKRASWFAKLAPLRSSVILMGLKEAVDNATTQSTRLDTIRRNINELLDPTLLTARKQLVSEINTATESSRIETATKLLLEIGDVADLQSIQRTIPHLDFTLHPLRPQTIERLAFVPAIKRLTLTATATGDDHLGKISQIAGLEFLGLRRTGISNYGVGEISYAKIAELDLSANPRLDGSIIPHLVRIRPSRVDLRETSLKPADIKRLEQLLPQAEIRY